jgi:2-haloacid dehalogenase
VSGRIAQIKPDRKIFKHHAESFALDPAATFFVDDNAANVAGARAAGWDAVLFKDAPTLRADLRQRGFAV